MVEVCHVSIQTFFAPHTMAAIWQTKKKHTIYFQGKVASFHLLTEALKPVDLMTRLWFQEYVCTKYRCGSRCSYFSSSLIVCVCCVTGFLIAKTKKLMRSPQCNKNDKPAFNLISNSLSFSFRTLFAVFNRKPRNAMLRPTQNTLLKLRSNQRINTVKTSRNTNTNTPRTNASNLPRVWIKLWIEAQWDERSYIRLPSWNSSFDSLVLFNQTLKIFGAVVIVRCFVVVVVVVTVWVVLLTNGNSRADGESSSSSKSSTAVQTETVQGEFVFVV